MVLGSIFDKLNEEKRMLNELSSKYNFSDKGNLDVKSDNSLLSDDLLKRKYEEMDLLVAKNFLIKRFWKVRSKVQKFIDIFAVGSVAGLFLMIYWNVPILAFGDFGISASTASLVVPFLTASIGSSLYINNKYKIQGEVFEKVNVEYLDDEVLGNVEGNNEEKLTCQLEDVTNEIINLQMFMFDKGIERNFVEKLEDKGESYVYKFDLEQRLEKGSFEESEVKADDKEDKLVKRRIKE